MLAPYPFRYLTTATLWQDEARERIGALEAQISALQQAQATTPEAVLSRQLEDALTALDQANQVSPFVLLRVLCDRAAVVQCGCHAGVLCKLGVCLLQGVSTVAGMHRCPRGECCN